MYCSGKEAPATGRRAPQGEAHLARASLQVRRAGAQARCRGSCTRIPAGGSWVLHASEPPSHCDVLTSVTDPARGAAPARLGPPPRRAPGHALLAAGPRPWASRVAALSALPPLPDALADAAVCCVLRSTTPRACLPCPAADVDSAGDAQPALAREVRRPRRLAAREAQLRAAWASLGQGSPRPAAAPGVCRRFALLRGHEGSRRSGRSSPRGPASACARERARPAFGRGICYLAAPPRRALGTVRVARLCSTRCAAHAFSRVLCLAAALRPHVVACIGRRARHPPSGGLQSWRALRVHLRAARLAVLRCRSAMRHQSLRWGRGAALLPRGGTMPRPVRALLLVAYFAGVGGFHVQQQQRQHVQRQHVQRA
jgi:hypothetical protein